MTNRYAIIRSGLVENMTRWDGESDWTPPEGTQAILAPDSVGIGWSYDGTEWTVPEPPPVPVPTKCTGLQARFALNASGDRDAVETLVAASPIAIRDYWDLSTEFYRAHPVIELMRVALGWTTDKMDTLFREAAAINVDAGNV